MTNTRLDYDLDGDGAGDWDEDRLPYSHGEEPNRWVRLGWVCAGIKHRLRALLGQRE